ncbi:DUF58 domain-containing protein [Aureliella helgolandensis]|nr:DUF58 domain-containing protein [Aureliella helgolandensis]
MRTASGQAAASGSSSTGRRSLIDPIALMQIKNLTLRAKTVVDGFTAGLHRSPLRGFSVEFAEYRPYVLGDDPRSLDWKLLARTDRYYVKQFEDETNRRCYLAIDQSKSMEYGTQGYTKSEYARTLAATIAYYLSLQRDAVGVMTCGTAKSEFLPPRHRTGHLQHLMRILELESTGIHSDLAQSLEQLAGLSRRRGMVVIISDLLTEPDSLLQPLGYLRGRGHDVLVIRILDRSEIDLSIKASSMLQDLESGQEMYVDPTLARSLYRQRFDTHEAQLLEICHRRKARLLTVTVDQPLETVLLEMLGAASSVSAKQAMARSAAVSGSKPLATTSKPPTTTAQKAKE